MPNFKLDFFSRLPESEFEVLWKFYQNFLKIYTFSVQSKSIFSREQFYSICNNEEYFKIKLFDGEYFLGFWVATANLDLYPESHYSHEYFKSDQFLHATPVYLIGDNGGFVSSIIANDLFRFKKYNCIDILAVLKKKISLHLAYPIKLVINYSLLSSKMSNLHFLDTIAVSSMNNDDGNLIKHLDQETFVFIHWVRKIRGKTVAEWLLGLLGEYFSSKNGEDLIFSMKRRLAGHKFRIERRANFSDSEKEECYALYHRRLQKVNQLSPQKLEYSKLDFLGYLDDSGYNKYLLIDHSNRIKGIYIVIGKANSDRASWVSPSWRIADAYIKLILVEKEIPAFGYIFLFVAGSKDLLDYQGSRVDLRILADWSEKLNGKRFRRDLNIIPAPLLSIVLRKSVFSNGRFIAEILTRLANFSATQIDSDEYLLV